MQAGPGGDAASAFEVLHEKPERKGRLDHYSRIAESDIDSKTGSVIITAFA